MINYNPKDWWKLIFAFYKSNTFRKMIPGIIGMAMLTCIVAYLEKEILKVNNSRNLTLNLNEIFV
jgi:ion channel-forming bestrophin family protein